VVVVCVGFGCCVVDVDVDVEVGENEGAEGMVAVDSLDVDTTLDVETLVNLPPSIVACFVAVALLTWGDNQDKGVEPGNICS
jgi:hypothetical protein